MQETVSSLVSRTGEIAPLSNLTHSLATVTMFSTLRSTQSRVDMVRPRERATRHGQATIVSLNHRQERIMVRGSLTFKFTGGSSEVKKKAKPLQEIGEAFTTRWGWRKFVHTSMCVRSYSSDSLGSVWYKESWERNQRETSE